MKKLVAIFLFCLLALLLIAARPRPRPCGTRTQCFNLLFPIATVTPTVTSTELPIYTESNSYRVFTPECPRHPSPCIEETITAMQTADIGSPPPPPLLPSAYPPPVTAPPAGYP